jgi:hypothetical protein
VTAFFVDDQLDHLVVAGRNPAVKPFLASWGYVKNEWLHQKEVPVLDRPGLEKLAGDFIFRERPAVRLL